ncbi:unnamed protein product [Candidula unifasciata]|uniref:Peptidyl-prolyl cis-trans isomerase n=1 Tax=Candidula unifasciata TaxID=100452 RepID=A0A8S3ZE32_9EUPU|nr:unnamed protein product [Candidula unifasciata]
MHLIALCTLSLLVALGSCNKNYTVTSLVELDIEVKNYNGKGDDLNGKVVIGLFGDTVPVATLNFKTLCEGFKRPNQPTLSYKNTICHRISRDMFLQCGDVFNKEGYGSTSIYGEYFNDENFIIKHTSGGIVTMANKGKDTNGSHFIILLGPGRYFDNKHVAFGKVVSGYQYIEALNRIGPVDRSGKPKRTIKIVDCTAKEVEQKYELTEKDLKTDDLEGIVGH